MAKYPAAGTCVAAVALILAACGQSPTPSTADPSTTPQDGVTPPASAPNDPAAGEPMSGPTPPAVDPVVPVSAGQQGGTSDWRQVASASDASSLGRLDQAWRLGRAEAEDGGFADQVEALGPLVDPNGSADTCNRPPGLTAAVPSSWELVSKVRGWPT